MNRSDARQQEERITIDSPRTTAPAAKPWQIRAGIILVILGILVVVLLVVRFGVGGPDDATSDPANTPAEVEPAPMLSQPAPDTAP